MTDIPDPLTAADERRHPPGDEPWWNESWYFDFATADASLGGYVRIGLYPNQGSARAWYWACVVGEGRPLVIVVDHDVAPPGPARWRCGPRACGPTTRSRCRSTT